MTGEDKSYLYSTLNYCHALLNAASLGRELSRKQLEEAFRVLIASKRILLKAPVSLEDA